MSYYSGKRTRNIYDPYSENTFNISRTRIELFMECPRCFYIDRRLGVDRPPGFPFTINNTVDSRLKNEFDKYRLIGNPHPLMKENNVDAIPANHPKINEWRENFKGIKHYHEKTNITITGAIDDLWINSKKELIIVDYKATSNKESIYELNNTWHNAYRRQMDIYQWLLIQNENAVSEVSYFLYCNAKKEDIDFNNNLNFEMTLIPYKADPSWIENKIYDIKNCLDSSNIPEASMKCDYCKYIQSYNSEISEFDF